jgi:hypothetical protein
VTSVLVVDPEITDVQVVDLVPKIIMVTMARVEVVDPEMVAVDATVMEKVLLGTKIQEQVVRRENIVAIPNVKINS